MEMAAESEAAGRERQGLSALLDARGAALGQAPALVYRGRQLAYADLAAASRRVAGGLARLGVGPGDRVALWLPNVPAYMMSVFACARLGAIAVAVNTRYRAVEVGDIIARSGARVLLLWPEFLDIPFLDILADIDAAALGRLETVVLYDEGASGGPARLPGSLGKARTVPFSALLEAGEADPVGGREDGTAIFTTSGTTKAPKFVLHPQRSLVDHAFEVARSFGFTDQGAVPLQALPLCGVFGFCQMMAAIAAGACQYLQPVFDAANAARALESGQATHLIGSDEMVVRLLDAATAERPFPKLRHVGFAAFGHAPEELVARADRRGVRLVGLYGMSEVQALFSRQSETAPIAERAKAGGRPVSAAARVRVADPDSGRVLAPGEDGEIQIQGPSLMAGYFGDAAATAAAFTADGFFRTGDLGRMEADGRFIFLTRMGDVLRLGGFLVSPAEIEAHLLRQEKVSGAQVVGMTTPAGPRAAAFVTLKPGASLDEAELAAWCRQGLAGYKVPARFVALDAFPVTVSANGVKIQRAKLREMAAAIQAP